MVQVVQSVSMLTHVTANYFGRVAIAVLSENGDRASSYFCTSSSVPSLVSAEFRAIFLITWLPWHALSLLFLLLHYISLW